MMMSEREKEIRRDLEEAKQTHSIDGPEVPCYHFSCMEINYLLSTIGQLRAEREEIREACTPVIKAVELYEAGEIAWLVASARAGINYKSLRKLARLMEVKE